MKSNNYDNIEQIFNDAVSKMRITGFFDLSNFCNQIENEFARLGFRESARGG